MELEKKVEQEDIFMCSRCEGEYDFNDLNEFNGELICDDCYFEDTVLCDNCDTRIWSEESYSDGHISLCERCFENYYCRCYDCDRLVHNHDSLEYNGDCYCQECYEDLDYTDAYIINSYDYKPNPIFYGEGIHYGLELEVDEAGKDIDNAELILDIGNSHDNHIYIKHDGSLLDGFEIVSHPMSLDYHQHEMDWRGIMKKLISLGYLSHDTSTCGLHIHVEKAKLGKNIEEQEETISNILYFVETHWKKLLVFSRRTPEKMQKWASRYGCIGSPKEILDSVKNGSWGRYVCVNIQNRDTIEFRMFRGTLKYSTFIATIQLIDEICNVALFSSEEELKGLTWHNFVSSIDKSSKSRLIDYLRIKGLYVDDQEVE